MTIAVDNPIINSPFDEPAKWWDYHEGHPVLQDGRRAAGYYRRSRTAPTTGPVAQEEFIPLPLVNDLRTRVISWREAGYPGVTPLTRQLLEHWRSPDRERRLFFCQLEAAETIVFLVEARPDLRQGLEIPTDEPLDARSKDRSYRALQRWALKLATGSGKTVVMAMLIAWSVLNKATSRKDTRFSDAILVVCPNLTIRERLQVLYPSHDNNFYTQFDLVPPSLMPMLAQGRYLVTNWHGFQLQDDSRSKKVVQRGEESENAFCHRVLKELGPKNHIMVINDEAHHAYRPPSMGEQDEAGRRRRTAEDRDVEEATIWVSGLDRINAARGISVCLDFSATPFYIGGSGHEEGEVFPWIVCDFGLVDAIECGIVKVPRVPVDDNSGQPIPRYFALWQSIMSRLPTQERQTTKRRAKPEGVLREAEDALVTLASEWKRTFEEFRKANMPIPPAMIVVCDNTDVSKLVAEHMQNGRVFPELANTNGGEVTLRIDSKLLDEAESAVEGQTKQQAAEILRQKVATVGKEGQPGEQVRCVVSVAMLTEGWDAQNVTQILGLRAFTSQLLCEQVVGRGLRRTNYDDFTEPEYVDVYGIPFEVIPVKKGGIGRPATAKPHIVVKALPERESLAITFPRVEGYVLDVKHRIRCDIESLPYLRVHPQEAPTEVTVKPPAGYRTGRPDLLGPGESEVHDRGEFYKARRPQAAVFEMASEITSRLKPQPEEAGSRSVLFPQVLKVVETYLAERVTFVEAQPGEIALERYKQKVIERLSQAIEPDTDSGEAPILPVIERFRPTGSTKEVIFRATRPCFGTEKSHVSHVVADSAVWEHSVAYRLERLDYVVSYVKNDHMDFVIPYDWQGQRHNYRPDFLARLLRRDGSEMTAIVEVKGYEREQEQLKQPAAERWVKAVNHDGRYGQWAYVVIRDPATVAEKLESLR